MFTFRRFRLGFSAGASARTGRRASGRRATRRAAVAVLTGLTAFVALQAGTAVALERYFPGAIDPDYGARVARLPAGPATGPDRPLTVVALGSSHTFYGLRAEPLQESLSRELGRPVTVVNFGFAGAGGVSQLLMWNRLRSQGIRPDLVMVEAWPKPLEEPYLPGDVGERRLPSDRLFLVDVPLMRRYNPARRNVVREVATAEVLPFSSRRLWMLHALAPGLLPAEPDKIAELLERLTPPPLPPAKDVPQWRANLRPQMQAYVATVTPEGPGYEALDELLRSCREVEVPAAILVVPEGPVLRGWYGPGAWESFQARIGRMSRECGAPIFNTREWIDDEDDFLDSHHLLPGGAERFTDRLGRDYLLPALRGR